MKAIESHKVKSKEIVYKEDAEMLLKALKRVKSSSHFNEFSSILQGIVNEAIEKSEA